MMPGLEISISTLFLVIIAASATLAGAMAAVAWRNSRELLIWSWALGSNALAHVLYALRGQISDLASIVVDKPLALMIDVDHFKLYNDCHGHQAGDDCLIRVASVLQQSKRASDLATRYGGEEFALIAFDTGHEGAAKLGADICRATAALALPHAGSPYGKVTVSIGAAVLIPGDEGEPGDLIRLADAALYRAKNEGRNCVSLGWPSTAHRRKPSAPSPRSTPTPP